MTHPDRLTTLISQFEITAKRLPQDEGSNLALRRTDGKLEQLYLVFDNSSSLDLAEAEFVNLHFDLGGNDNPLVHALPPVIEVDLTRETAITSIMQLILTESATHRCGGDIALNRLCELLFVNILRHHIETQGAQTGMFAGLAHPKLCHAVVAMHDKPGERWQVDDLMRLSGMSRSQFMAEFQSVVGKTPIAYLKQWRMVLARNEVLKGTRINEIARRFGYSNGDAFCRAFTATYGIAPTKFANG